MANDDREHERDRLTKLYAGMSDGELQQIAADAGALSELALQILADEIQRRGLSIVLAEAAVPIDRPEKRELVTIRKFRDLPEALLARGTLESGGIEAFLDDANMVRMNWFISNLLGGIKLRVKPEDSEEALKLLGEPAPESFAVEGVGTYEQPHCPQCGSIEIRHEQGVDKRFALPALYVAAIPLPVPRNRWVCGSCGNEWQDADEEPRGDTDAKRE